MVRYLAYFLILLPFSLSAKETTAPVKISTSPAPQQAVAPKEETVSPLYMQVMKQWVESTNFAKSASDVVTAKLVMDVEKDPQIPKPVNPQLVVDLKQYFYELFVSEKMTKELAKIYSNYFSIDEMAELVKFYKSPIGQKLIKTNTEIMLKTQDIGIKLLKENEKGYMEIIGKYLKK